LHIKQGQAKGATSSGLGILPRKQSPTNKQITLLMSEDISWRELGLPAANRGSSTPQEMLRSLWVLSFLQHRASAEQPFLQLWTTIILRVIKN